jgi:lipopolysaccharide/colanic/teichoic acid biosynthesis glycosyltransferase
MEFSLLTFVPHEDDAREAVLDYLLEIMQQRLRETDEVGWFAKGQIAAVLPYTSPGGAIWLADEICNQLPVGLTRPKYEVFVYPSDSGFNGPVASSEDHRESCSGNEAEPTRDAGVSGMESLFVQEIPKWKRLMDIAVAGSVFVLLSPLMLLIALSIKVLSPGPALFKQRRTGLGGRVFEICKFRTMSINAEQEIKDLLHANEQDGPAFKMKNDPRVTSIGRFLRRTSLDELPQLWNVLRGDMSLVGPRPLPCHESDACAPWQQRRLDVTPGVTCIWQTSGRSQVTFDRWMRMDINYIQTRSLRRDIQLLFQTVWAVASCRGAR